MSNYEYDNLGRLVAFVQPSPDGVAARPSMTYSYDAAGDTLGMTDPDGNTTQYVYDGLERQIETIEPNPGGGSSPGPTTTVRLPTWTTSWSPASIRSAAR